MTRRAQALRWLVLAFGFATLCATSATQPARIDATPPPNEPATDEQGRATIRVILSPTALETVDQSELRLTFTDAGQEPLEGRLWLPGIDVHGTVQGNQVQVTGYHRACDLETEEDGRPLTCTLHLQLALSRPATFQVEAALIDASNPGFPFARNGEFGAGANVQVTVR